jgi:mRNA interferase MazF
MKGEVYRLAARGQGHEQKGRRYAVVLQPDWLTLSTWIVASTSTSTSTSARETSFRPSVTIANRPTLVMCDQLATVDLNRLTESVGFLTIEEMQRVDAALTLVLDL